jgi:hypothetical protein
MKTLASILLLILLVRSDSLSQPISLGVRLSYLPSYSQEFSQTFPKADYRGFNLVGGDLLYNFDLPTPISVGVNLSFGRKILMDYHPSSPQPPGTGPTDMSRRIELFVVELPVLYRVYLLPDLSMRAGVRLGHVAFKRYDHLLGQDFETPANKIILTPQIDLGIDFPSPLRLAVGAEYRPMDIVLSQTPSPDVTYTLKGVWYCGSLAYVF